MWINGLTLFAILAIANCNIAETDLTVEAAFQGRCGHNSPCEQLCYEIHDGMYECDCTEGYELNKNGYSCQELNSTYFQDSYGKSEEDILYQKGVSFSAKLDNHNNNLENNNNDNELNLDGDSNSNSNSNNNNNINNENNNLITSNDYDENDDDFDINYNDDNLISNTGKSTNISKKNSDSNNRISNNNNNINSNNKIINNSFSNINNKNYNSKKTISIQNNISNEKHKEHNIVPELNSLNKYETIMKRIPKEQQQQYLIRTKSTTVIPSKQTTILTTTPIITTSQQNINYINDFNDDYNMQYDSNYYAKQDMSIYDDVNNNKLNLRKFNLDTYQNDFKYIPTTTTATTPIATNVVNYITSGNLNLINITSLTSDTLSTATKSGSDTIVVSESPRESSSTDCINSTIVITSMQPCLLECGLDGNCDYEEGTSNMRCRCPFGKTGNNCNEDMKVNIPRFTEKSWLAFPALRGAYKHVQLRIEFRPESFDGIILLTGERDDLTGDFMALLIHQGFIEFWFDCGSGVGNVRSKETVLLNQWNTITIYRHRWDAWMVLNHAERVQGRSKGLFSRITFREPVFLGGTGNITGLANRLPIQKGIIGCIRKFIANEHEYQFVEHPLGDVTKGYDIQDCTTDKCVKYPCQHGGKCLPSEDQGAVCLCPLGFGGDLCEMRLDLQVPSFNGSSYLRYAPLGDSALIWLELQIIIKPQLPDGIILYSGHEEYGDYIALSLNLGYIEFAFDLGSGPALVRSEFPLTMDQWHTIKISRTARLAVLKVNQHSEVMTISSNGFWHLSLPHSLFLGGIHNVHHLPVGLKDRGSFVGCVQKVEINGRKLSIISEALGGTNVDNCPHACVAKPCGPLAQCIPLLDSYECRCNPFNAQCNKAEEIPLKQIPTTSEMMSMTLSNVFNLKNDPVQQKTSDVKENVKNSHEIYYDEYEMDVYPEIKDFIHKTTDSIITTPITSTMAPSTKKIILETKKQQQSSDVYYYDYEDKNTMPVNDKELEKSTELPDSTYDVNLVSKPTILNKATESSSLEETLKHDKEAQDFDSGTKASNSDEIMDKPNLYKKVIFTTDKNGNNDQFKIDQYISIDGFPLIKRKKSYENENYETKLSNDEYLDKNDNTKILNKQHNIHHRPEYHHHLYLNAYEDNKNEIYHTAATIPSITNHLETQTKSNEQITNFHYSRENDDDRILPTIVPVQDYQTKQLIRDMKRIMKNSHRSSKHNNNLTKKGINLKKQNYDGHHGACFNGMDSYFHYSDAETMSQIISYKIDLNLRFKTHSQNGIILWSGRQSALETDDYLSLGIENGYLHLRYNLGSGETNIHFNTSRISDGLWHRVRAMRNSQEGFLEVDGRKSIAQRSPGKLRQLNTDTGLYVGGMPDVTFYTRHRYYSGIVGCISEIILTGELRLNLDPSTLGTAHNVETGIL